MTFSSAAFTDAACEAAARDPETLVVSALGAVGVGKSSLLNAIAGERLFDVGDTYVSDSKEKKSRFILNRSVGNHARDPWRSPALEIRA